jgi:hypothetical protein
MFVYDASSHSATRLVLRFINTSQAEHIQKDCTAFTVQLLSPPIVTMDASNILELCVAILTLLSIQFVIITALAAHSLSHRFTPPIDPGTPLPHPQNPLDTSPQNTLPSDMPPSTHYAFPYAATVNDNASSLYSDPTTLPSRPQNPVPHDRASIRIPVRRHSYGSAHNERVNTRFVGYVSSEETVGDHVL